MCKQLWMGMESQPLHNGMVWSPAVTQAFSQLSKSGSTRAMATGCWWFHMPIHFIYIGSYTLYVLHIDVQAALDGYGASTTAYGNGMVCSPALTQAFSRLSKSGSKRAMVTGCRWFHMPIHCIWSGPYTLYVLHIDVQMFQGFSFASFMRADCIHHD